MPKFEVLDVRIAAALNKIIHNSHFRRRISLEEQKAQKHDRFLRGRQIAYLIYGYFRVTGANDSVENYADLFTISLRNDDIQEFDSKWDGILLFFLHKERGANQQFINYTMDLLSVPEYVIKKGRPHGHRYGKKLGDKKYHTANQLKKKCKKKYFQGIHDRFIRDPELRNRMIENNRDEELCRKWDAVADEDHTHHLMSQEYSLYKSKWWLHSNKESSNTVRTTHRSDFKKALSTLQQLKQKKKEPHKRPRTLLSQKSTMGTKFFFMVELARFMVDSLFLWKSRWR